MPGASLRALAVLCNITEKHCSSAAAEWDSAELSVTVRWSRFDLRASYMNSTCREYIRTAKTHNNPAFQHFQERPSEQGWRGRELWDIWHLSGSSNASLWQKAAQVLWQKSAQVQGGESASIVRSSDTRGSISTPHLKTGGRDFTGIVLYWWEGSFRNRPSMKRREGRFICRGTQNGS